VDLPHAETTENMLVLSVRFFFLFRQKNGGSGFVPGPLDAPLSMKDDFPISTAEVQMREMFR